MTKGMALRPEYAFRTVVPVLYHDLFTIRGLFGP